MNRSVRRTHPMSIDTAASTSSVPYANSVEPPPRSNTRNGASAVEARGRAGEGEAGLLVAREQLGPRPR